MSRSRPATPLAARPDSGHEASAGSWWKRARYAASQSLSEHPVFTFDEPGESQPQLEGAVAAEALRESQCGALFARHLARMFRVRLRVTNAIGLLFLPTFTAFYFYLFPETSPQVPVLCGLAMLVSAITIALTFLVKTLTAARLLAQVSFGLFTLCCASVIPLVTIESVIQTEAGRAVQLVVMASFIHILITALILPLRLRDALGIISMVLIAMGTAFRASPTALGDKSTIAELFVIATVAALIALLSYFNSRLRRRVFDASFKMALQTARMKEMSQTDALTGGFNRHHIGKMLDLELARTARFERPLSLLMFDLDNFKIVNDTLGHAAGDEVLQEIHRIAGTELREVDILARYGGDEFLILLPETDATQAARIAKRLHARVGWELPTRFGAETLPGQVSLSIGVFTLETGHAMKPNEILARVDDLLYSAKKSGKNRVVVGRD